MMGGAVVSSLPLLTDTSKWRPGVSLSNLEAAGIAGNITRASQGLVKDETWDYYKQTQSQKPNFIFGAFHYFRASVSPIVQADLFWDIVAEHVDIVVVDVERTDNLNILTQKAFGLAVKAFVERLKSLSKMPVVIYTNYYAWLQLIGSYGDWAAEYPLWVAHYNPKPPTKITPWKSWLFWQFTNAFEVPGEKRKLDMNRFNGSLEDLYKFAGKMRNHTPVLSLEERVAALENRVALLEER